MTISKRANLAHRHVHADGAEHRHVHVHKDWGRCGYPLGQTRNSRLTIEFKDRQAHIIDYKDYH